MTKRTFLETCLDASEDIGMRIERIVLTPAGCLGVFVLLGLVVILCIVIGK